MFPEIAGGAGDDRLSSEIMPAVLAGGDGRDVLFGGTDGDQLFGGPGTDVLRGRGGDDLLLGDATARLGDGPRPERGEADDVLDGGRGRDSASWAEHTDSGVDADLRRGSGRTSGDRDRLRAIEGLIGTPRSDRLAGDAGRDYAFTYRVRR